MTSEMNEERCIYCGYLLGFSLPPDEQLKCPQCDRSRLSRLVKDAFWEAILAKDVAALRRVIDIQPNVAGPHAPRRDGLTALFWATDHGDIEMVALLLQCGANIRARHNFIGEAAAKVGLDPTLHGFGHDEDVLAYTVQNNRPEFLRLFLDRATKEDVNHMYWKTLGGVNRSLLQSSVMNGYPEVFGLLLEHGADVHHRDEDGCTALHSAGEYGRLEMARTLITAGAQAFANKDGLTPRQLALLNMDKSIEHQATANLLQEHETQQEIRIAEMLRRAEDERPSAEVPSTKRRFFSRWFRG